MPISPPARVPGSPPPEPPASTEPLVIELLDGFTLRRGGEPLPPMGQQKSEHLLAYLALNSQRDLARESLAGTFWPDAGDKAALTSLRAALLPIRRVLEPQAVGTDPEGEGRILVGHRGRLRLVLPPGSWIDALEFERLATEALNPAPGCTGRDGRIAPHLVPAERRITLLESAVRLYRGPLLPGCDVEWCETLRMRLALLYEDCLRGLMMAHQERKEYTRAVHWARVGLTVNPEEEEYHREIMRSLALLGDRAGAVQQFEECQRALARLGLEPSPETWELYQTIRLPPTPPDPPPPVSYPELTWPLTGRDQEQGLLWEAWTQAVCGVGQLALLSGEPGIGKSRLGQELLRQVETSGGLGVYGQGYHMESPTLYQPIVDAIKAALSLADRPDGPRLELPAFPVLAQVARLVPELRERFPELPPSLPLDQETVLFDGLSRFFLGLARQHPLCLFIDDLQWADEATLRFLHYLWRQALDAPLLLVGAFREEEARDKTLLVDWVREAERRVPGRRLRLPRLPEAAVAELLGHLARKNAEWLPGLARLLHLETEGNPLFLVWTVRALFEAGLLTVDACKVWHAEPDLWFEGEERPPRRLPLPQTVKQAILDRLERLTEPERRLLEAAAVLGQPCEFQTLCRVADQEPDEALAAVERLLESGLLRPGEGAAIKREEEGGIPASSSPSSKQPFFCLGHDRFREIVYEQLSQPRRQVLHLRCGRALEAQFGARAETRAAELAMHFMESRHAEAMEPAARYLLAAGTAARSLSAYAEANRHLETALDLLDALHEDERQWKLRGQVMEQLHLAYQAQGRADRAESLLERYIDQCQQNRYWEGEARACNWLGLLLMQVRAGPAGSPEAARVEMLLRRALDLCAQNDLQDFVARPSLGLAYHYWTLCQNPLEQERLLLEVTRADLGRLEQRVVQRAMTLLMAVYAAQERWEEAQAALDGTFTHGGPDSLFFHLFLARCEEQFEREGKRELFTTICREWLARARGAGMRHLPAQSFLEGIDPSQPLGRPVLDVSFAEGGLPSDLRWIDPDGVGAPAPRPGQPLILAPPHGPDLWPPNNLNAPRLMLTVEGDLIAETRVGVGAAGDVAAGLLLWRDERNFLRLERVRSRVHGEGIQLEGNSQGSYGYWGRGRFSAQAVWLRMERFGSTVRGLCSEDRQHWWTCGAAEFPEDGQISVGVACVAWEEGMSASFERLTVWTGVREGNRNG